MEEIITDNLDGAIEEYQLRGFRLDMIFPADDPREALISNAGEHIRLLQNPARSKGTDKDNGSPHSVRASATNDWVRGRAGMQYRDLTPENMRGQLIASHIRVAHDGEVPDHVHYHKIRFQMIYCLRGPIRVVYEDQGEPFWIEAGDCVLQPPEIRHRVLESTAGAEVIEVTAPAEHETWIDHEMVLPNTNKDSERIFKGQKFLHSRSENPDWVVSGFGGYERRETGFQKATGGLVSLQLFRPVRTTPQDQITTVYEPGKGLMVFFEDGGSLLIDFLRNIVDN